MGRSGIAGPGNRIRFGDRRMTRKRERRALTRRQFTIGAGLAGGCLATALARRTLATQRNSRPNVIVLVTDDQRWDAVGYAGNSIIRTPNIDGLAKRGVAFKNAFVTTSICMASRASILTGQYERRHGCTFGTPPLSDEAMAESYPVLLRQAGYRTGCIGKFGVSVRPPAKRFFDWWRAFQGQGKYEQVDEHGVFKHLTRVMEDHAVEFLRGCRPDRPFCLCVNFKAPHCQDGDPMQFIYDPIYEDLYQDVTIPVPKTATPRHFEALPEFLRTSEARERWKVRFATPAVYQESVKAYYRLITGVDRAVGRIVRELKELSLDDNTAIVLIGDNGFYLGEHGLAGKWFPHEESIRVPLLVYDPRLPASKRGRALEQMALNVDVAPTILSMAGLPVPDGMQGRSLLGLLHGSAGQWREDFFYEHLFKRHNIPKSEAVRTQRWKYVRYFEQKPVYEQVYDLEGDPHEEHNLVNEPSCKTTVEALRRRCDELRAEVKRHR